MRNLKRGILAGVILLALLAPGCGNSRGIQDEDQVLVGRVFAIGNEPFVHPGLDVGGTMYALRGSKEVLADLLSHQSRKARIHAKPVRDLPSERIAEVVSVEYLPE